MKGFPHYKVWVKKVDWEDEPGPEWHCICICAKETDAMIIRDKLTRAFPNQFKYTKENIDS